METIPTAPWPRNTLEPSCQSLLANAHTPPPLCRNSLLDRSREYRRGDGPHSSPPRGGPPSAPGSFSRRDSGVGAGVSGGKDYGREALDTSSRGSGAGGGGSGRSAGGLLWGDERERDRRRGSASPYSHTPGIENAPSLGGGSYHHHGRGGDFSASGAARFSDGAGGMGVDDAASSSQDQQSPPPPPRVTGRSSPAIPGSSSASSSSAYPQHHNHHHPRGTAATTSSGGGSGSGLYQRRGGSGSSSYGQGSADRTSAAAAAAAAARSTDDPPPGVGAWRAGNSSSPPPPPLRVTNPDVFKGGAGEVGRRDSAGGALAEDGRPSGAAATGGGQARPVPMPARLSGLAAIIAARSEDSPEKPVIKFFCFALLCFFFFFFFAVLFCLPAGQQHVAGFFPCWGWFLAKSGPKKRLRMRPDGSRSQGVYFPCKGRVLFSCRSRGCR